MIGSSWPYCLFLLYGPKIQLMLCLCIFFLGLYPKTQSTVYNKQEHMMVIILTNLYLNGNIFHFHAELLPWNPYQWNLHLFSHVVKNFKATLLFSITCHTCKYCHGNITLSWLIRRWNTHRWCRRKRKQKYNKK